jgi:hypothetical protein
MKNEAEALTGRPGATYAIPEKLTQQQALQVLIDSAAHTLSKGVFTDPQDVEFINLAISTFKLKK